MNGFSYSGDGATRNQAPAFQQRSSVQSLWNRQIETDSSLQMDKSMPSSDPQLQKMMSGYGNNQQQCSAFGQKQLEASAARQASLLSTPVVGAQFGIQSQMRDASPSVDDFDKRSPILGATQKHNAMYRSSFASPAHFNTFNPQADPGSNSLGQCRGYQTEHRNTMGSVGGRSMA